jgi:hypothetical protein
VILILAILQNDLGGISSIEGVQVMVLTNFAIVVIVPIAESFKSGVRCCALKLMRFRKRECAQAEDEVSEEGAEEDAVTEWSDRES